MPRYEDVTPEQLALWKSWYEEGLTLRQVAKKAGFNSQNPIRRIFLYFKIHIRGKNEEPNSHWTENRVKELTRRYRGEGARILAREWGISENAVFSKAQKLGLKRPRVMDISDAQEQKIKQEYSEKGPKRLSKELELPVWVIKEHAKLLKLLFNKKSLTFERKDKLDVDFFRRGWTPEVAYVVGYIWSDGTLDEYTSFIRLCASSIDEDIIRKIRDTLKSTHKVKRRPGYTSKKGYEVKPTTTCTVSSKNLLKGLITLTGLKQNKSNEDIPLPVDLPFDCTRDFARGILDGDGSVGCRNLGLELMGGKSMLESLQERIVRTLSIPKNQIQTRGKFSIVRWNARQHLESLYSWLYDGTTQQCYGWRKRRLLEYQLNKSWTDVPKEEIPGTTIKSEWQNHEVIVVHQGRLMCLVYDTTTKQRLLAPRPALKIQYSYQ